eukprot:CAMPEP_0118929696 /NCGR_PEP_ID=MMETSP1169-20130426/6627_1 /TAXON_ID=36882 /ORGANISM="Pyramimonas obovata, Strain CCMP722" /LENGTH=340 /DNA_ID=CAMNT_0006871943 /DNA_START=115 /DNA_END=1134 /DNA_ORIENTATION=+
MPCPVAYQGDTVSKLVKRSQRGHTIIPVTRRKTNILRSRLKVNSKALSYVEPVFRPPAEWRSLILQVTNGCSWNRCTFCEMYTSPQKAFRAKPLDELERELSALSLEGVEPPDRVFLADGDAMTLPAGQLKAICEMVRSAFPSVRRISSYCLPRNLQGKTVEQLAELKSLGLSVLYVGCESGDDQVLQLIEKGETFESSLEALRKIHSAGIKSSVMILNGLGGRGLSEQHAVNSARLMNAAQPNYLSTLVVSFPLGTSRFEENFAKMASTPFVELSQSELFLEMETLLSHLELERTIFRSDHASNYLVLKGVLQRDKAKLLHQVRAAIRDPSAAHLRPEW